MFQQQQQQLQQQQLQQQQLQQQQLQQQLPTRPSPVRRTHSSNLPHGHAHAVNGAQRNQASRNHRHLSDQAQGQSLRLAAQEAQRQRDMFVKKPTESFQNLTQIARTQSAGLLTQLLNPKPEMFPVGHPFRGVNGSSAAVPNAVEGGGHGAVNGIGKTNGKKVVSNDKSSGGWRPKGRPKDQELEDDSGNEAEVITPSQAKPIPVLHPYNLPPPAAPSTPRTTRRLMLSTELSESLRRNLLWERQVSKVNLTAAVRRSASSGGSQLSQQLKGQILQPLTTAPNMVQLLPKGTMAHPNPGSPIGPMRPEQVRTVRSEGDDTIKKEKESGGVDDHPGSSVQDEKEKEQQKRRLAMARNRSWANDYHFAGW